MSDPREHSETCHGWYGNPPKMDNRVCDCRPYTPKGLPKIPESPDGAGQALAGNPDPLVAPVVGGTPELTALDGSLTIRFLQYINAKRAERWHGLKSWSALEWAGAMAGETGEANGAVIELLSTLARFSRHVGEASNAAKKLKRIEGQIANINLEDGRSLTDVQTASAKVVDEIADTVIYGVLLAERVGLDLEEAIRLKFNRKSEEYGFPERIPANDAAALVPRPEPRAQEPNK